MDLHRTMLSRDSNQSFLQCPKDIGHTVIRKLLLLKENLPPRNVTKDTKVQAFLKMPIKAQVLVFEEGFNISFGTSYLKVFT